jgi:group I intron endonuclease
MFICRAILKYGMSKFSLGIVEYCEPEKCLEREDFYISSCKPQYNILLKAGSILGYTHSLETRNKMSISQKAFDRTGENNPMYGVPVSEETRAKILEKQKHKCQRIEVLDLYSNETISYYSIREASRVLGIRQNSISMYFIQNQKSPYKGRYIFKKI